MTKTTKWVLGSIGVLFLLVIVFWIALLAAFLFGEDEELAVSGDGSGTVALIELKEPIFSSENTVRQFKKFRENSSVKAIVFRVESPGGGVAASQEIYQEVRKTKESGKPVIVSMGAVAASGGYYVSCGADRIVANPGTLTGSIGVITQFMHFNQLMDKIGVGATTIKSGKFKDTGSPFRGLTPEDKKYFQETLDDVYTQFVHVVETERKLPHKKIVKLADGRVFTGRYAYEVGLVDTLGTYEDAIAIAARIAGMKGKPKTIKEKKKERLSDFLFGSIREELSGVKDQLLNQPILQYKLMQP